MNEFLKHKVNDLPDKPGCYLYLNSNGKVIYVGKAKSIKKRVLQYFNRPSDIKTTRLVREIQDIDYFVVNNEKESLLLEENLIKKYRPRFNILLNDDKAYPYIIITNDKDPQYKFVRKFDKKALRNYGPFPIGSNAKNILITLQRIYPLRRCNKKTGTPCFYFHINECSGYCFKEVPRSFYENQIKKIDNFFKNSSQEIKEILLERMKNASENLQYEEAQRIKELFSNLSFALSDQNIDLAKNTSLDVITYKVENNKLFFEILFFRNGRLFSKMEDVFEYFEQDISEVFYSYINQIYTKNIIPNKIIIPNDINLKDAPENLKSFLNYSFKKQEISLIDLANQNLDQFIKKEISFSKIKDNDRQELLIKLQKILNLKEVPNIIEMFDVSNIIDEIVIGACIVYKNGIPNKNEFRKYNINLIDNDDPSRMQNMVYRRYQKKLFTKSYDFPDLIIVDGGELQKNAVQEILIDLDLNIPIIGLIKDKNHKTNKLIKPNNEIIELKNLLDKEVFNFLSQMQFRVDNFAKTAIRKKQSNSLFYNNLLEVKGLGNKRLQELLKYFGTIKEIEKANFDDLNKIIKNKLTTINLLKYLSEKKNLK